MRANADAINTRALTWVVQLDRQGLAPEAAPELQDWLDQDPRHQGAFLRAQAAWQSMDRAGAALGLVEDVAEPIGAPTPKRLERRGFVRGAVAAGLAVVGLVGWQQYRGQGRQVISTARGEIRRVPLEDGSLLAINTQTDLRVDMQAALRVVNLDRGEAWVQVATDASRPFVVKAGDVRVRAIGTAFSVRRLEAGAEVIVSEGVVEVWSARAPDRAVRLAQGGRVVVEAETGEAPVEALGSDVSRRLAWREGEIVLNGETLAEAIAAFNRYNEIQLEIEGETLAQGQWIGRFRTNEPEAFARAVAVTTGAWARRDGNVIRLTETEKAPVKDIEN